MTTQQIGLACEMHKSGFSTVSIAKLFGVKRDTISRHISKVLNPSTKNPEILVLESKINSDNQENNQL